VRTRNFRLFLRWPRQYYVKGDLAAQAADYQAYGKIMPVAAY
jgi:hypothetical protein